jgi:hypothetical protein
MRAPAALIVALLLGVAAHAAPAPAAVRAEIVALLGSLESSGCEFNRNGSWYNGADARMHLLRKLEYLESRTTLHSAEQFIELAATASSSSGRAYQVRCGGSAAVPSAQWLAKALAASRASGGRPSASLRP